MNSMLDQWTKFPTVVCAAAAVYLVVAGVEMLLHPEAFPVFYVDLIGPGSATPVIFGIMTLSSALLCLLSGVSPLGVAFVVATYIGRAGIYFSAWASDRFIFSVPATRWVSEVLVAAIILIVAGRGRVRAQ